MRSTKLMWQHLIATAMQHGRHFIGPMYTLGPICGSSCHSLTGGQNFIRCKWFHLVAKFAANPSGATWWYHLQPMLVAPPAGQIYNQCKWYHLVAKFVTNASDATWWPNFSIIETRVMDLVSGSVLPLEIFWQLYGENVFRSFLSSNPANLKFFAG